ncbi:hypothetical protein JW314_08120 [Enterobacter roggenkampii]|uniref:hypothetical protein n=1 Tax=Enterobacter TaxID=547 RepID=UPI0003BFA0A9|nr:MULTISPECIES: hypothetical protein [Enterobacter]ESN53980.1 hypothetical protein L362_00893 [Enterobacter sp. MGH 16]MBW4219918.1 hypothetical protein [Enterobacter roggenkampii]MCT6662506.1 hypothetical protein [Enterobacter mori]
MLEGRKEKLHCGSMCFAVFGSDDDISDFVEYLKTSAIAIDVRVIAGRDHLDRIKIVITGSIVDQLSFDAFRHQYIDDYCSR